MKTKIITLILAIIFCLSSVLGGCSCSGNKDLESEKSKYRTYSGTHIQNVSESETEYLVNGGKSNYKILISEQPSKYSVIAAQELTNFFLKATNIVLPIEKESKVGYAHNDTQHYISIGNTKLFESTDLVADSNVLKKEGFRIVTKDNNIYIFTSVDVGNAYGVYELLRILFNWEYYADDCIEIDEGVTQKKLPILDVTEVPDFQVRKHMQGAITYSNDKNSAIRFGYSNENYMLSVGDTENGAPRTTFHNSSEVLPRDAVTNEDKWQAEGNNQLCYTAH